MFESTLAPRAPRSRKLAVVVSVGLHVGLGVALLVSSFWKIDRLEAKNTPVTFVDAPPPAPPPAAAAPPPPAASHATTRREKPRIPDEIVQPTEVAKEPEPAADEPEAVPEGDPDGETGGLVGGKKGGMIGGDPNGEIGGIPGGLPTGQPATPPPTPAAQIVPAVMLEGARIAGTAQILLPDPVRQVMTGQGIRDTKAVVKLCLTTGGVPDRTTILRSTGFPAADARILTEMTSWRYRPTVVNGRPVPVCTSVVFQYRLR